MNNKLEIELSGERIFGGKIFIDGHEINKVTQIRFESGIDRVNLISISMIADVKIKAEKSAIEIEVKDET